jgi:hypothetical protein
MNLAAQRYGPGTHIHTSFELHKNQTKKEHSKVN